MVTWKQWLSRWVDSGENWQKQKWFAIDCESNGVDARNAELLSIAWVPIRPPFLLQGEGQYHVLKQSLELNQSAVIHQLTTEDIKQGDMKRHVLSKFCQDTQGAYLVAHHALLDKSLIGKQMRNHGLVWQPAGWYDTLRAERKILSRRGSVLAPHSLQLKTCSERYGLSEFKAHHALADASACGELFLAQQYKESGVTQRSIEQVLQQGQ